MGDRTAPGVPADFAGLTISLPFNDIEAVRAAFRENAKTIAAVILEPIPANAGLYFPRENFLEALREECTRHGALLIFDEVMTGFRVARGGAQELFGVRPDLTALGKVIGGGLPVGAFGGRAEIMDQLSPDRPGLPGRNAFGKSAGDGRWSRATARTGADRWLDIARETRRAVRRSDSRDAARSPKCRARFIASARCSVFSSLPDP